VPIGLSLMVGWCWIGATPRGQPRTPAVMLPHGCEGLRVRRMTVLWTFRGPCMGHPGPRQSCATRGSVGPLSCPQLLTLAEVTPRDTIGLSEVQVWRGGRAGSIVTFRIIRDQNWSR